ncbi:MAG: ornithine cyclodeaminase family protein [Chloroflexi bacterium]|nr:MAG: ornithine cyclodeaminase family protein [Chloroflexota bacterium]
MTRLLNINVKPVATAQQAIEMADILITATTAQEPVVHGKWLKAGCHINAIGSNWPHKRELDVAVLQRCALIATDSLEQAYNEAGDLIIPANDGLFDWNLVHELGEIITDEHLMRVLPDDITLYRGLGTALEDVTTAAHVYHLACQQGIGEEVDLLL